MKQPNQNVNNLKELIPVVVDNDAFINAVKKISPELLEKTEEELRNIAKPTRTDYAIRMSLWNEIRLAQVQSRQVRPLNIYSGISSYNNYYYNILNNPEKLAWVLQPVQEYEKEVQSMLPRVTDRYYELINMDIKDDKGHVNPALARILLSAIKQIEERCFGYATKRVESLNINVPASKYSDLSYEELEKKISEIDAELEK